MMLWHRAVRPSPRNATDVNMFNIQTEMQRPSQRLYVMPSLRKAGRVGETAQKTHRERLVY